MKTIVLLVALQSVAGACPKGYFKYEGNCARIAVEEKDPYVDFGSSEKPRRSQQPEWEVGLVHVDASSTTMYSDADYDKKIKQADDEGKRAAGLNAAGQ